MHDMSIQRFQVEQILIHFSSLALREVFDLFYLHIVTFDLLQKNRKCLDLDTIESQQSKKILAFD